MKKHSLKLALLGSTLVAYATLAGPAFADPQPQCGGNPLENRCIAAIWSKKADVLIEITDGGVTGRIFCHHNLEVDREDDNLHELEDSFAMLRKEAFSVCVGGNFEVGNNGKEMINLKRSAPPNALLPFANNPFKLGIPFVQVRVGGVLKTIFLEDNGQTFECTNGDIVPLYRLDKQDLDSNNSTKGSNPLPLGTLVNIITENQPDGKCIGIRTTFQYRMGTCKIWKVRKYFNACSSSKRITQIKEFEQVNDDMELAGGSAGPGGSFTAVGLEDSEDHFVTLMTGNTGANPGNAQTPIFQRSAAGSVSDEGFDAGEFCSCALTADFSRAQVDRDNHSWLELFLSYFPGGVNLQGKGKAGSEKFVTFHIDVE